MHTLDFLEALERLKGNGLETLQSDDELGIIANSIVVNGYNIVILKQNFA